MPPKKPSKKTVSKKETAPKAAMVRPEAKKPVKAAKTAERIPKPAVEKEVKPTKEAAPERYWEAVGRRKTAVARVRLFTRGEKGILVNSKPLAEYFRYPHNQRVAAEALEAMKSADRFRVSAKVRGGGLHAQAEAIRHGAARALVLFNPDFRKRLKRAGFITRDPRMKERKKFGLKGARKAPQWAKR